MRRAYYAICVGINDYPGTGADLNGCVNDALDWTEVLRARGYDVDVLLDAGATRERVLGSLGWAVQRARYGDRIVFTYSGHGSWVPDTDGDETDRRDEVLVCHDYADGGLISDDDLHRVFQAKRFGVRVTILSDSCHSGTVQRFANVTPNAETFHLSMENEGSPSVPRFLSPASLGIVSTEEALRREARPQSKPRLGPALISGCADYEYSYDAWIGGRPRGAFTAKALDALGEQPRTLRAWHDAIRLRLPSQEYPQSPQLQGTAYQKRWRPLA